MSENPSNKNPLNERQHEAVRYIDGPLLVLAGAGSGKTSVITHKIHYLISQCQIPARKVFAVTFTNKAAREMNQRVRALMPSSQSRGLNVCTFHHLGLDILKREFARVGLKSGFSIFDESDVKSIFMDLICTDVKTDQSLPGLFMAQVARWKSEMRTPEDCLQNASNDQQMQMARVYQHYDRRLKAYNAVDFEDLIYLPIRALQENQAVHGHWLNRVGYLLVDEYQDTSPSQYQLLKLLVAEKDKFTVVGDDDQSIYAWRGATPENLSLLKAEYPRLKVIKLEQNYRSTTTILDAANALIANNEHIFEKRLWSQLGVGDPIRVMECDDEKHEVEWVAQQIMTHKLRFGKSYRDYAVLYRGNYQSRLLEIELQSLQIPYKVSGGQSFFGRTEIKDLMAYLRLLINEDDDNAFLRVVNVPKREIGASTLEKLAGYATNRSISMTAAVDEIGLEHLLAPKATQKLRAFTGWLKDIREFCRAHPPSEGVTQLLKDIEYQEWLSAQSSSPKMAERKWQNVQVLVQSLASICQDMEDSVASSSDVLEAGIAKLVLRDILEQKSEEDDSDRVSLMTMHAAKGLEFPHVTIMGVEENMLPHRTSIEEDNIPEERRLFYVGMTRAKQTLTLTYASSRKQFGEFMDCAPSRFLEELSPDKLEWKRKGEVASFEEKKQVANTHLSHIRNLLGT